MSTKSTEVIKATEQVMQLLQNPLTPLSDIISKQILYNILVEKQQPLHRAFQARIQAEITASGNAIATFNDAIEEMLQARINNLMAFMAYTEPRTGSTISTPRIQSDAIVHDTYLVQRIFLTNDDYLSPYTCYGLLAPPDSNLPSRIIFPGTTYCTANGFAQSLLADSAPGGGVGSWVYASGKTHIQKWINDQFDKTHQPVIICGQSLGGAMCMQLYVHQPNKIQFYAFNPPFLTNAERRVYNGSLHKLTSPATEHNKIYHHVFDPISLTGHWFPATQTDIGIFGTETDFTGPEPHRSFKAHASCITGDMKIEQVAGAEYLKSLQQDEERIQRHKALKVVRGATFASLYSGAAISGLFRKPMKLLGMIEAKSIGPEPLPTELHCNYTEQVKAEPSADDIDSRVETTLSPVEL